MTAGRGLSWWQSTGLLSLFEFTISLRAYADLRLRRVNRVLTYLNAFGGEVCRSTMEDVFRVVYHLFRLHFSTSLFTPIFTVLVKDTLICDASWTIHC